MSRNPKVAHAPHRAPVTDEPTPSPVVKAGSVDRRRFLAGAGGLLLAFTLDGANRAVQAAGGGGQVTAWIRIGSNETITVLIGSSEMGQGIYSGLAQLAAEELMVPWGKVRAEPAPASQSWITGGSSSIRGQYLNVRRAGAAAREMLVAAAAQTWGVPVAQCQPVNGTVRNTITGATLTYGTLAPLAATLPVPANPALVPDASLKIIGKSVPRTDLPEKVNGSAKYGIDTVLPDMVFATIKHCPWQGGTLRATPPIPPGAIAVVPLGNAVAVVATNTWKAMQAAKELQASWRIPSSAAQADSAVVLAQAQTLMANGTPLLAEGDGNLDAGFASSVRTIDATYTLPYLAHGYMEVLSCTVRLSPDRCEIWVPTQAPGWVLGTAAAVTGLPASKIQVTRTLMGGGLGRKIEQDYVAQALQVAKALRRPVKLTWPREEDMQHDQYRPMALVRVRAGLDASGNVLAWDNRIVSPSILFQRGWIPDGVVDGQSTEGATELPYAFGSRRVEYVRHPAAIPVGFWRSVGHSINAFAVESAIDEAAFASGIDPYVYRKRLLAGDARRLKVLNTAATLGGWTTALPAGHARGIAFAESFGSLAAQVVEISEPVAGTIRLHQVACAIDCGRAINPNSVVAQIEGGLLQGLSAALWGEVPFSRGRAVTRNFDNYRVLTMRETPAIKVSVIQSGAPIGGVGEPGLPPAAPALANAYFRLKGTRVRTLPFFPGAGMGDD